MADTMIYNTTMPDRETSLAHIDRLLADGEHVTIALANLDFFINVSSKVGKNESDNIIRRVADFFRKVEGAWAGGYGGDEFILVFTGRDIEEVMMIIESVRKTFRREKFIGADSIYAKAPLTVSFGVASSSGSHTGAPALLKMAEIALAMAKKQGRNRVVAAPEDRPLILPDDNAAVATVAGGGLRGCGGDGGQAFDAQIKEPYGVCVGKNGELYIADRGNHRVRVINGNRVIETIAGRGGYGYSGDNGPAREARLNKPSGVAVDARGRVFIADTGNHRIRKIDAGGIMRTLAGTGEDGYDGDGKIAAGAKLSRPGGVVTDARGNVYTNDYGNNVIRMIAPDGVIRTVAGSGGFGYGGDGGPATDATFDRPYGLGVTADGSRLYVADYGNHAVREIDMSTQRISTVCGGNGPGYRGDGGKSTKSLLNGPFWVTVWTDRYLLVADAENHCIRICDLKTHTIETLIGSGRPGYVDGMSLDKTVRLNIPAGMAVDENSNMLYIADYGNNAVRRLNLNFYRGARR